MEDINGKILQEGYGLKILQGSKTRTGFVCKTNGGMKELRKYLGDAKSAVFEGELRRYLLGKGFRETSPLNTTLQGKYYYEFGSTVYILEDYLLGQEADFEQPCDVLAAAGLLARFHKYSAGFRTSVDKSNIDKLPRLFEKRVKELIHIKKNIDSRASYSSLDIAVVRNFSQCINRGRRAFEILHEIDYNAIKERARKEGHVCHNAFKNDAIKIMPDGNFMLNGFWKSAYDCTMNDLADLIRRYMKRPQAGARGVGEIIAAYQAVRPIDSEDRRLLYALCTFPYKFFRICNEYYNKRRVCISDAMLERIDKCTRQMEMDRSIAEYIKKEIPFE